MTTILQLLKSRTVLFAILLAVLSVLQGYVGLLPLTPIQQMYVGLAISVIVTVLLRKTGTGVAAAALNFADIRAGGNSTNIIFLRALARDARLLDKA